MILLNVNESISNIKPVAVLQTHYNVDEMQWYGKSTITHQYTAWGWTFDWLDLKVSEMWLLNSDFLAF